MKKHPQSVVMMGATGAVGTQALAHLLTMPEVNIVRQGRIFEKMTPLFSRLARQKT